MDCKLEGKEELWVCTCHREKGWMIQSFLVFTVFISLFLQIQNGIIWPGAVHQPLSFRCPYPTLAKQTAVSNHGVYYYLLNFHYIFLKGVTEFIPNLSSADVNNISFFQRQLSYNGLYLSVFHPFLIFLCGCSIHYSVVNQLVANHHTYTSPVLITIFFLKNSVGFV